METSVDIHLTHDQALVLFEFFARFEETDRLRLLNNAEFVALSEVAGQLQRTLTEPFDSNYAELLSRAQERLAGDYEGLAPGVEP